MTERTPDALRELTHDLTGYSINPDTSRWIAGLINGQLHNQTVVDTLITPFYSKRTARYALFARALGAQLGLTWSSGNHTSTPIFIVSSGPGSASFRGWFQTREIGQLLKSLVKKR
jgi:alkaline phosphatase